MFKLGGIRARDVVIATVTAVSALAVPWVSHAKALRAPHLVHKDALCVSHLLEDHALCKMLGGPQPVAAVHSKN